MARGDIKWFAQGLYDLCNKIHDLDSDDIRMGIVTNSTVPAVNTSGPHWGGTGTTNFATTQVATATAYTGPIALGTESLALTSTGVQFRISSDVTVAQDASGFTDGYWGIIYNNTDANKRAIAYVDLGGPVSIASGALSFGWNGSNQDVLQLTQS